MNLSKTILSKGEKAIALASALFLGIAVFGFRSLSNLSAVLTAPSQPSPEVANALRMVEGAGLGLFVFCAASLIFYARCVFQSKHSVRNLRLDMLHNLVGIGIQSGEAVIQLSHMKQAVDTTSQQSQSMASAVEEMVTSIKQISERTHTVSNDSQHAERSSITGLDLSHQVIDAMKHISETANQAASEVHSLDSESDKIGEIVSQIESIARQTNLLALNANIEAMRAGEAGKGFAVVASEVKTLATQTGNATKDIQTRIESLRSRMGKIVGSMEDSVGAITKGNEVITALGRQLEEVATQIRAVSGHMTEVAAILTQQTSASNDISKGTGSIATLSQENTKEIHDLLTLMDKLSEIVNEQIGAFADIGGKAIVEIAKNDHITFKKGVADTVAGRKNLTAETLPDHHSCRLGKWYDHVDDRAVRSNPAFLALVEPHQRVHDCGKEVLHLRQKGQHAEAVEALSRLSSASHEVVRCLDDLAVNM